MPKLTCRHSESVTFGIAQSATVVVDLDETEITNFTAGRLHGYLKERGQLSQKDAKGNSLTMRLYVCEILPVSLLAISEASFSNPVHSHLKTPRNHISLSLM